MDGSCLNAQCSLQIYDDDALATNHQRRRAGRVGRSSSLNLTVTAAEPALSVFLDSHDEVFILHQPRLSDSVRVTQTVRRVGDPLEPATCFALLGTRRR